TRLDVTYKDRGTFEPVNLNALVEDLVKTYQSRAESVNLQLSWHPGADLPCVPGKTSDLIRVATNLLTNAISYTPAGRIDVRTYADIDHQWICLEFQDTGIGIAPEDLPHLFERFYRGTHVGSSNIPGTGLGLAIT